MKRHRRVLAALALMPAACVPTLELPDPPALRDTVEVEDDPFSSSIRYVGAEGGFQDEAGRFFLRSWVDRETGEVDHQVYVTTFYGGGWRFYERATALGGAPAEFLEIDRDVLTCGSTLGCRFSEVFAISVSDEALRAASGAGIAFKAYSRSGHELLIEVSDAQIQAQLGAIDGSGGP